MKNILLDVMMFLVAAVVTSCSDDDSLASRGLETVEMPISISIPAEGFVNPTDVGIGNEAVTPASATTRAPGDPGTYEQFHLPQYIYLFLCNKSTNGTESVIYQKIEIPSDELTTSWEKTVWGNDSIYTYKGNVSINLPLNRSKGKIYAAASYIPLHTSNVTSSDMKENTNSNHLSFNCDRPSKFGDSNYPREYINESKTYTDAKYGTEDAVKNIIFSNITLRNNMQDVYSTPYNKKDANGDYYGTITDYASNVPNINIVLYHVATKVDVQWSIDEDYQGTADWAVPTVKSKSNPSDPLDSYSAIISDNTYLPAHTYWTKYECETMVNSKYEKDKLFFSLVELRDLPKYGCFLFRPLETGYDSSNNKHKYLGTYKLRLIGSETTPQYNVTDENGVQHTGTVPGHDKSNPPTGAYVTSVGYNTYYYHLDESDYGKKYYGREVRYVIPKVYTLTSDAVAMSNNHIKMRLLCNNYTTSTIDGSSIYNEDHATKGYNTYIRIAKPTGDKIYTPWIRVFINVDTSQKAQNVMKVTDEPALQ
ncbi:MAG: hypothetical protein PUD87_05915 [Prevotellaceae bacterium]|nr:hypothetical protein [Prevotellaceae bacterium]